MSHHVATTAMLLFDEVATDRSQIGKHKTLFSATKAHGVIVHIQYGHDEKLTAEIADFGVQDYEDIEISFYISSGSDAQLELQVARAFVSPILLEGHPRSEPEVEPCLTREECIVTEAPDNQSRTIRSIGESDAKLHRPPLCSLAARHTSKESHIQEHPSVG